MSVSLPLNQDDIVASYEMTVFKNNSSEVWTPLPYFSYQEHVELIEKMKRAIEILNRRMHKLIEEQNHDGIIIQSLKKELACMHSLREENAELTRRISSLKELLMQKPAATYIQTDAERDLQNMIQSVGKANKSKDAVITQSIARIIQLNKEVLFLKKDISLLLTEIKKSKPKFDLTDDLRAKWRVASCKPT